jgi:putative ABC transport system permease protein
MKVNNADLSETLDFINQTCRKFDPKFVFDYEFLDKTYEKNYESQARLGKLFNTFALLAIIISCLGLFGLASYVAELKTKEIGIRKVLGATSPQLVRLLSKEFLALVLVANIIAWPVAYYFMKNWLEDFAYRIEFPFWVLLGSAILAVLIALITVSSQALRAASADPVKSLRYE